MPLMTGNTINISDISKHTDHDFSGSIKFDKKFNYRTQSMLLVPIKEQECKSRWSNPVVERPKTRRTEKGYPLFK